MTETRPAVPADAEAIAVVHVASWRATYRALLPGDYLAGLSVDRRAARWAADLTSGSTTRTTVALVDGAVCGFASVGPGRDSDLEGAWEVYAIYLSPRVLGRGVGRDLMAAALRDVPPEVTTVALWVLADNTRARSFYEAAGFVADGLCRDIVIGGTAVPEVRYVQPARARPTGRP